MSQCECGQEIFDEECVHLSDAFTLVEPTGDDRIPAGHLAYFTARNRRKIYSAVIKAFKDSGLTQIQLAKRLGKRPDVICHWLSGPGNWEIDTVSILLFGISGGELGYRVVHPLRQRQTVLDDGGRTHDGERRSEPATRMGRSRREAKRQGRS